MACRPITLWQIDGETVETVRYFILAIPHDLWDLSFPFAVAKTFNTVLKRSGESGYPCLVPDF